MADDRRIADDGFARYYTEKLWNWIPEVHRDADFTNPGGPVLRSLIEVIAGEAATARRAIDRLWEDVFIDYADDWAVPYIGDLVGTRMLDSVNARGRRADVARTISYRHRAGTMPVLADLITGITGWDGAVVESFRRLARHWHGLDDPPVPTGRGDSPAGAFADLRSRRACDRLDGPFDGFAHRPDFRRLQGSRGRYAVPKLNVHLFRQKPQEIRESMGLRLASRWFSFDPSGRERPLFANNPRRDIDAWTAPHPWDLRAPIAVSLLDHALFAITPATDLSAVGPKMPAIVGSTVDGVRTLAELARLDSGGPPSYPAGPDFIALQAATRLADSGGKYQLYPASLDVASGTSVAAQSACPPERISAAAMAFATPDPIFPPGVTVLIDPVRGLARLDGDTHFQPLRHNIAMFDAVGAGGQDRSVVDDPAATVVTATNTSLDPIPLPAAGLADTVRFPASKTYQLDAPLPDFSALSWTAANQTRPYVLLARSSGGDQAILRAAAIDPALPAGDPANDRTIDIDGLWLTIAQSNPVVRQLTDPDAPVAPVLTTIIIDAKAAPVQRVTLRNVTLDPGGERLRLRPCEATVIPHVALQIHGQVQELVIENSITGPIEEFAPAADPCSIGRVVITDSIVQSIDPSRPAIDLKSARLDISRSTVFGDIRVDRLYASEVIAAGLVVAADNQHGCFRFSATGDEAAARLPQQFESHRIAGGIASHMFVSERYGDPGYAQLSPTAPAVIGTGAENRSEMGVFARTLASIKAADLRTKLDEYAPLNTISGLIYEN